MTKQETHQGSGRAGCWTRGQAWGVYGFAAAYWATGEEHYLEVADRAATYYFQRAGDDLVPFYCFDDPDQPHVPRDSSAAAITSAGLWILAEHARDPVRRQRSRDRAEVLLQAMTTEYLTPQGEEDRRPRKEVQDGTENRDSG